MKILGVCAHYHDSAAALVVDGIPVAFAEEERFNRRKHTSDFPVQAIEYCLKHAGIGINQIDEVAFYLNPRLVLSTYLRDLPSLAVRNGFRAVYQRGLWTASFLREADLLRHRLAYRGRITWVEHHIGHAGYVYHLSAFDQAAVLTIDSIGERATTTISLGEGHSIRRIESIFDPHSLGYLYGAVTQHLGFKRGDGEGTVMGLASYGDPSRFSFNDILRIAPDGRYTLNLKYVARRYAWPDGRRLTPTFEKHFGPPRHPRDPLTDLHRDLAATLQSRVEQAILALAKRAVRLTGAKKLCIAGGVALNSVANARVRNELGLEDLFVAPSANDAGTALGIALHTYAMRTRHKPTVHERVFLGPEYSDAEIQHTLDIANLKYRQVTDPSHLAASLLAQGKILGWFQGRMESGPRALGNRSIIADPSAPGVKDRINSQIKFREPFRPFAPSILQEYQHEWFACGSQFLPYMLEVVPFLPGKADSVPAVAHVDGTGRVQTVRESDNDLYYQLIKHFYQIKGIPIILNTSFNIKGEPIVCSPGDALRCFYSTGLDALVIGHYVLEK